MEKDEATPFSHLLDKGHRRELIYQFIDIGEGRLSNQRRSIRVLALSRLCLLPPFGEEKASRRAVIALVRISRKGYLRHL